MKKAVKRTRRNERDFGAELGELIAIKKLLILQLLISGASQRQIASALGVDQSHVSRLFVGGIGFPKAKRK